MNHLRQVRTEFLLFTLVLWPCVYRLWSILLFAAFVFFHLLVYFSVWCFPCRTHVLNSCLQNVWNGCKCVMIYIRNVALALVSDSSDANYPRLLGITRHQSWLQDHKMRKFLSLILILNISNFIGHTVLIICSCQQNVLLNKSLKFRFINKTTTKVILKFEILT